MNVLYVATYEGLSGASYSLLGMICELREKGVNPFVILLKDGKLRQKLEENNIPYLIVRGYPWVIASDRKTKFRDKLFWIAKKIMNYLADKKVETIIRKKQIDVIHINAFTAAVGVNAAKKTGIPCIWHIREFVEEDLKKEFWNKKKSLFYLSKADIAIAISESVYNKFKAESPKSNIVVVYNGVPNREYLRIRDQEILNNDVVNVLIPGRIDPGKGHEELIDAIELLVKKEKANVHLKIAGVSQSKEYGNYIKEKVRASDLDNNIEFLGYRDDLPDLYKKADIVVVASRAEAFGRVTVEAMMAGCLVIGADTAGTKELIQSKYGLLYEQGVSTDLAEKILFAMKNKEKMKKIANNAREHALNCYSAKRNAQDILKLYDKCLKKYRKDEHFE